MERKGAIAKMLAGAGHWVPFASRTAAYGLASCVAGPLTGGRASLAMMRRWCVDSTRGLGIDVDAKGAEKLDAVGPCILVSNHESVLDILVLGSVLDVDYKWVAKRGLFQVPFMGWHLALAGHIPVDRQRKDNFELVDRRVGDVLGAGGYVLFFPEGTRSLDGKLRRFKTGAFTAAVRHSVPVVPIVLDGTGELMKKGDWDIDAAAARRISLRVMDPLRAPGVGDEKLRAEALRDRAFAAMSDVHDESRARREALIASASEAA